MAPINKAKRNVESAIGKLKRRGGGSGMRDRFSKGGGGLRNQLRKRRASR